MYIVQQIVQCCQALLGFATKYGEAAQGQPGPQELRDMTHFATLVVRLLEDLRRLTVPDEKREPLPPSALPEDSRPPKRPWEDMARDDPSRHPEVRIELYSSVRQLNCASSITRIIPSLLPNKTWRLFGASVRPIQVRARQASPRASTASVAYVRFCSPLLRAPVANSALKQRATPPGKCHSCNIRETPEWRRGPDGARTLCNACGLREYSSLCLCRNDVFSPLPPSDYAKLMRKRDKALGADGKPIPIDLQTLRASTASSRGNVDVNGESSQAPPPPQQQQQQSGAAAPYEPPKAGQHPQDSHHHPPPHTAYHLMPPSGQSSPNAGAPPPPHMMPPPRNAHEQAGGVPPPPWYVPQPEQDGAYARSSHPRGSPQ